MAARAFPALATGACASGNFPRKNALERLARFAVGCIASGGYCPSRGVLAFLHPEGVALFSPGQRPGTGATDQRLRPERAPQLGRPFRAGGFVARLVPGRCPGLEKATPSG